MKEVLLSLACGVMLTAGAEGLVLAERGAPPAYTIVVPEKASPSQRYAAEELRDFTEQMTGVKLPIATDAAPLPAKAILLGKTKYTNVRADVGTDGFRLVARPPHLLVIGSRERGTLYGVYELLERFGGCRWYSSWCSKIPRLDRFAVPATLDDTQTPAFALREPFWWDAMEYGAFAARLRANHRTWRRNEAKYGSDSLRFGGGLGSCHTFDILLPVAKYFDSHPEYFSLVNGRRLKWPTQLCLTNPDVLRIVTSNVLGRIRSDPGAKFYGVSQNDNRNYCRCPKCAAVDAEEESHSGTMVRFVNAVAEAVEKEFPDVIIETLAYQYTRKPPKKTRLRRNVMPCLCSLECDYSQPMDVSPHKETISFCEDVRGWSRQCDSGLYVWDYEHDYDYYQMPFPNVYALCGNVRFFQENGVKHLFVQGTYQGRHGDFAELKAWLVSKWMWNPDLPMEQLLDDFFAGYFGKGAPFVRRYFEAVHRLQLMYSVLGSRPLHCNAADVPIPDVVLGYASDCWKQAIEAVKDDPDASYNVRMGALSVDFLRLERMRRKWDKLLCLAKKSSAAEHQAEMKSLAKSILDRIAEAGKVSLSEGPGKEARFMQAWRELVERKTGAISPAASGEVEDRYIIIDKMGKYADDPKAADGRAVKLNSSLTDNWNARFLMHRIEFEPGVKYTLRVRARVDKLRDGEAFWAGVYDPVAKCCRGKGAQPRTDKISDDYDWYEVCTWEPKEGDIFWIGPGRCGKDGKPAIKAVWIDKLELSRVDRGK